MSTGNVISAFSEEDVERLTGITIHQLRYWDRSPRFFAPSLAYEDRRASHSRVYSFRDVVCLKIINAIRNESKVPLQHLRDVKQRLLHLGEDLWTKTTLYILNKRVVFYNPDTDQKEDISGQLVLEIPLRVVSGNMEKAVRSLRERPSEAVGKIEKHRGTAANKAVIAGTRIPVKSIKAFHKAGYSIDQIREQYPILTETDIKAALSYGVAA